MNPTKLKAIELANGDVAKAKEIEAYLLDQSNEVIADSSPADENGNTGYSNTGHRNTGNFNTGNGNTGNFNTGYRNTGYYNTGSWNTTNQSNGYFNTEKVEIINVFDKPCMKSVWDEAKKPYCLYFNLTEWIDASDMTNAEKEENPTYQTTDGYLKAFDYKEAFTKSVLEASKEERDLIRKLPNFNNEKFLEISGVDLSQLDK